jgi:hypothetical protein
MFALSRTAVSNSIAENRNPPSPEIDSTLSAGRTMEAAIAPRKRDTQRLLPVGDKNLPCLETVEMARHPEVEGAHVETEGYVCAEELLQLENQSQRMDRPAPAQSRLVAELNPLGDDCLNDARRQRRPHIVRSARRKDDRNCQDRPSERRRGFIRFHSEGGYSTGSYPTVTTRSAESIINM